MLDKHLLHCPQTCAHKCGVLDLLVTAHLGMVGGVVSTAHTLYHIIFRPKNLKCMSVGRPIYEAFKMGVPERICCGGLEKHIREIKVRCITNNYRLWVMSLDTDKAKLYKFQTLLESIQHILKDCNERIVLEVEMFITNLVILGVVGWAGARRDMSASSCWRTYPFGWRICQKNWEFVTLMFMKFHCCPFVSEPIRMLCWSIRKHPMTLNQYSNFRKEICG